MSIASEISRLQTAKTNIKAAIEAKGVTVPSSATIDTYDDYVSQISGGGGDTTPSAFTSWSYNDYGKPTNIVVKDSVTSIPSYFQYYNNSLSSCTIHSGVTSIGSYAFSSVGNTGPISLDVSNINLSNVSGNRNFSNIFSNSHLIGSITIPNNLLYGATSGLSSTCYQLFYNTMVNQNKELTINAYADNSIIPRQMFCFSTATTVSKGKINIIIHGTPTFLSENSFKLLSGTNIDEQSVTFVDCTTPPDAQVYDTSYKSPFYQFKGTIYVPSAGLTAWKEKYTVVADKIQAIPNS